MPQCQSRNHWYYTHVLLHHDHLLYRTYKQNEKQSTAQKSTYERVPEIVLCPLGYRASYYKHYK